MTQIPKTNDVNWLRPWGECNGKWINIECPNGVADYLTRSDPDDPTRPAYGPVVVPDGDMKMWQELVCRVYSGGDGKAVSKSDAVL